MTSRDERRGGGEKKRLPVRGLLAAVARTARHDPWRILAVAIAISLLTVLADIGITNLIDHTNVPLVTAGELISSALEVLGSVFLSGFLCRIVGSVEHGLEPPSIGQVAKSLPWSRLIRGDLLVVLIVVVGLILLVIPGLIAVTLLAIIGPVIEIEDKPVLAAVRRSAHLVRQKFWWVVLLATLPLAVVSELESLAPEPHSVSKALETLAIRGLGTSVLDALIGLVLVELAYQLIALDRTPAAIGPADARRPRSPEPG
jgi:predicted secreted protein